MKKVLYFAAIAAMFAACSSEELADQSIVKQDANGTPVNFSVYTQRAVTRAGVPGGVDTGIYGVTTASLKTGAHSVGFGVFGYYTDNSEFDADKSTPNFMYNQQVTWDAGKSVWTYEPVKYWPNEFGDAAYSDDIDLLTFFAYAPYVEDVVVSTGVPKVPDGATDEEIEQIQGLNITQLSKNTATGDPIVKYVVDTKPSTSVDLLWGVAAAGAGADLVASDPADPADNATSGGTEYESINGTSNLNAGSCFVNLNKEKVSKLDKGGKIGWNFKHALAQLNVQICAVVDKATPGAGTIEIGTKADEIVDGKTKVWVRSISLGGFTMKGALNLHSEDVNSVADAVPNWKDYDGVSELTFDEAVTFFDGLKDGKEGTTNRIQKNEKPTGLNPVFIQTEDAASTGLPISLVNLFAGANTPNDPIYVIPTNEAMNIKIVYDVETEDNNLATTLSDGVTKGSSIENTIYKEDVFNGVTIEAGKSYQVKIYVGLTSVKFDVIVTEWDQYANSEEIELPKNM